LCSSLPSPQLLPLVYLMTSSSSSSSTSPHLSLYFLSRGCVVLISLSFFGLLFS
jgi:hypothetical protein